MTQVERMSEVPVTLVAVVPDVWLPAVKGKMRLQHNNNREANWRKAVVDRQKQLFFIRQVGRTLCTP